MYLYPSHNPFPFWNRYLGWAICSKCKYKYKISGNTKICCAFILGVDCWFVEFLVVSCERAVMLMPSRMTFELEYRLTSRFDAHTSTSTRAIAVYKMYKIWGVSCWFVGFLVVLP